MNKGEMIVIQECLKRNIPLEKPDELDTLLEFAELVRNAVREERYSDVSNLICYTVAHSHYEAFYWAMGILDELVLMDYECILGKLIADYSEFIRRLGVDLNAFENDVLPIRDENGEIQSFLNIIRYKTAFDHIDLVTSENFDAKDNDYIQYMLVCHA